jgi:hypothetical protein
MALPRIKRRVKDKAAPKISGVALFVLSVGDEGAILVRVVGKQVVRRVFALAPTPEDIKLFYQILAEHPADPVLLLVDIVDQSYVPQTLPPVSSLSVKSLIKRRLERDYAPEDITGHLLIGRAEQGRKDWHFLAISMSYAPPLSQWVEAMIDMPNPVQGIYLLPVESAAIAERLMQEQDPAKKSGFSLKNLTTKKAATAPWRLLVIHQKVGGFRQVVYQGERLVFTRLTQPVGETTAEVIAGNVEQEICSTMEYLRRLSFSDAAGIEVALIADEHILHSVNAHNFPAPVKRLVAFTPYQAAQALGIMAANENDQFGDVVMACAFAQKKQKKLRLSTTPIDKITQFAQVALALKVFTVVVVLAAVSWAGWEVYQGVTLYSQIGEMRAKEKAAQAQLAEKEKQLKSLPADILRINDIMDLYTLISANDFSPLDSFELISEALGEGVLVKSLSWEQDVAAATQAAGGTDQAAAATPSADGAPMARLPVTIQLSAEMVSGYKDSRQLLAVSQSLVRRVEKVFDGYHITHSELPGAENETKELQVNFNTEGDIPKQVLIDFTITGPVPLGEGAQIAPDPATGGAP